MANVILILHAVYVAGVVLPIPLILIGAWRGWRWVRHLWFRRTHLGMIGLVVLFMVLRTACPLTTLEAWLRGPDGVVYEQGFIPYWVNRWLYHDWPIEVFVALYLATTAVIIGLYFGIPPTPRSKSSS